MRAGGADGRQLLALAEVRIHPQLLLALLLYQVHVHRQVLEIPGQRACPAGDKESQDLLTTSSSMNTFEQRLHNPQSVPQHPSSASCSHALLNA